MMSKENLRAHFLKLRKGIDKARREEAKRDVFSRLETKLEGSKAVLSYIPFKDEIDVSLINQWLASRRALILPKIEKHQIALYSIDNEELDLLKGEHGFLEPNPNTYKTTQICEIALIPGVAFDGNYNRIGFGYGHFDRFLKANQGTYKIGVGFREQLSSRLFEVEGHDIPMDELCLL